MTRDAQKTREKEMSRESGGGTRDGATWCYKGSVYARILISPNPYLPKSLSPQILISSILIYPNPYLPKASSPQILISPNPYLHKS